VDPSNVESFIPGLICNFSFKKESTGTSSVLLPQKFGIFLVMRVSRGPGGFGEPWNISKISKGKREHERIFREQGQG